MMHHSGDLVHHLLHLYLQQYRFIDHNFASQLMYSLMSHLCILYIYLGPVFPLQINLPLMLMGD